MGLLLPAATLAQQPQQAPVEQVQADSTTLQHSIKGLESARRELTSGSQQQLAQAVQTAKQALDDADQSLGKLKNMPAENVKSASASIATARSTLQQPTPDRQAAAQQLGQIIGDLHKVQQQLAQAANRPASNAPPRSRSRDLRRT